MDLIDLVQGSIFVMNGTNVLSVPGLGVTLPFGLGSVDVSLKVIEAPRWRVGHVNDTLATSQVDLTLTAHISTDATATLSALGISGLSAASLTGTVTITPKVAGATSWPTSIRCPATASSPGTTIALAADPITVTASESLTLAETVILLGTVNLINTNVTNATVSTTSSGGSADYAYPTEFMPNVGSGGTKRLGTSTIGLSGPLTATSANTTVLSLAVPLATSITAVNNLLSASIIPGIQNVLLPLITRTLGLELGGGDVGALDIYCSGVRLVGDKG
jgi:hypothetical protein